MNDNKLYVPFNYGTFGDDFVWLKDNIIIHIYAPQSGNDTIQNIMYYNEYSINNNYFNTKDERYFGEYSLNQLMEIKELNINDNIKTGYLTNDFLYSINFIDTMIMLVIILGFFVLIPFKAVSKIFKRGSL